MKVILVCSICVSCLGFLINSAFAAAQSGSGTKRDSLPEYVCHKVDREIALTGKLDDPLWQKAEVARMVQAFDGGKPDVQTEIRILYSDTTLYIGVHCVDDYAWGTFTERDSEVWTQECVEAFICPSGHGHQYYEINVSPKNCVFDACILNRYQSTTQPGAIKGLWGYTADGLKTMTYVEGEVDKVGGAKFWNAEFAIPLDQLVGAPNVPPKPGDKWRMNMFRIDSPKDGPAQYYSWSPVLVRSFHTPTRFGWLRFEE